MANVTPTTADKYIADKWTREVEEPFDKGIYFRELVTDRSQFVASDGDTLHIPFVARVAARSKSAGSAVTFDANTETEVTMSINKHKYFAFLIEDITKLQAYPNLQALYRNRGMVAVLEALDSDLGGLHASAGTNVSAGATVDDADILSAISALDSGDVPQTQRSLIAGYKTINDLRNVNKYVAYDQTGKTGLAASEGSLVADVYGVDIYLSNNVVDDSTNTHNLMFHKSGLGVAVQMKPTFQIEYSVDYLGWKCAVEAIYGVAVERAGAVVDIERTS